MNLVGDTLTKSGDRVGSRLIKSISPRGADKLYEKFINGPRGLRYRQGEKAVGLAVRLGGSFTGFTQKSSTQRSRIHGSV
jgi:hypothetical protein